MVTILVTLECHRGTKLDSEMSKKSFGHIFDLTNNCCADQSVDLNLRTVNSMEKTQVWQTADQVSLLV